MPFFAPGDIARYPYEPFDAAFRAAASQQKGPSVQTSPGPLLTYMSAGVAVAGAGMVINRLLAARRGAGPAAARVAAHGLVVLGVAEVGVLLVTHFSAALKRPAY